MNVLVLNNTFEPLQILTLQKALKLLMKEKAEIIKIIPDRVIRSVSSSMVWPSVIRLFKYIKHQKRSLPYSRRNILVRDKFICSYCGKSNTKMTVDHIIPTSRGGKTSWENVVACCERCNTRKGNKMLYEVDMKLSFTPRKPSPLMFIKYVKTRAEWDEFLFLK